MRATPDQLRIVHCFNICLALEVVVVDNLYLPEVTSRMGVETSGGAAAAEDVEAAVVVGVAGTTTMGAAGGGGTLGTFICEFDN